MLHVIRVILSGITVIRTLTMDARLWVSQACETLSEIRFIVLCSLPGQEYLMKSHTHAWTHTHVHAWVNTTTFQSLYTQMQSVVM